MKNKTLIVGIDAASWDFMEPLLNSGRLPTIRGLMETGISGVLESTMPPWTPTAWSSLVTGKNPGKHGVFDMLRRKPGSYEFTLQDARSRRGTPFWKYLNDAGIKVGLVNVPFTHPPSEIEGFMLCGFGTPISARDLAWPPSALSWLEAKMGTYIPAVPSELLRSNHPERILAAEKQHQSYLVEAGLVLAKRFQVDVLAVNLMLTDHANHKMPAMEQVHEAYVQSDSDIKTLLSSFKPSSVMLISDHGSSRVSGDFLLNAWLRNEGYCVYTERAIPERSAASCVILQEWLRENSNEPELTKRVVRRVLQGVIPRMPQFLQRSFWNRVERDIPFAQLNVKFSARPDFGRTALFPGSLYSGLLYFNLRGREGKGVLSTQGRSDLAAEIKAKLLQVKEPETGRPLFKNIFLSEELYRGPACKEAPDLILDAYGSRWNIRTRQPGARRGRQPQPFFITSDRQSDFGWHSREGIFIFCGSAFQTNSSGQRAVIMDVPSTLLHLYNVPVPEDWDGRVLRDLLSPHLGEEALCRQSGDTELEGDLQRNGYANDEGAVLADHLRALGYLD